MTKNTPLVSVMIPSYNHGKFIQETIKSVIEQDYDNLELIIIDDGSNDNSIDVIQGMISECEKRFVRFEFRHRSNKGLSATLNEAIAWSKGLYLSCLASDDKIKFYKISSQVPLLENNKCYAGVFGGIEILYKDGSVIKSSGESQTYDFENIFKHEFRLPAPTQLLRLSSVKKVGGFRQGFIIEDWMMWLDLTKNGDILYCDNAVVASYRRHDGNLSGQLDRMLEGRLQILTEFRHSDFYKEAKANLYMVQAFDTQGVDKIKSIKYVLKSLCIMPKKVFTRNFLVYTAKLFIRRKNIIG